MEKKSILTVKENGFKELFSTLDEGRDYHIATSIFQYKEHKFKIKCDFSNGDPLGFNYKKSLAKFDAATGKFVYIADCRAVGIDSKNDYYISSGEFAKYYNELTRAFYDYIKMLF